MKVRLGFAVIAHLPHPILLMDEVTAVGDAEFRKKCYATIERLLAEGRTLVLVSHNENDLTRFCRRGLYLDAGRLTRRRHHRRGARRIPRRGPAVTLAIVLAAGRPRRA